MMPVLSYKSEGLPENYRALIEFILDEIGRTFHDRPDNIRAISMYMKYRAGQVYALLGIMTKDGILSWNPQKRQWTVAHADEKAA